MGKVKKSLLTASQEEEKATTRKRKSKSKREQTYSNLPASSTLLTASQEEGKETTRKRKRKRKRKRNKEQNYNNLPASSSSSEKLYVICSFPMPTNPHIYSIYELNLGYEGHRFGSPPPFIYPLVTMDTSYPLFTSFAIFHSKLYMFGGAPSCKTNTIDCWLIDTYICDSFPCSDNNNDPCLVKDSLRKGPNMIAPKIYPRAVILEEVGLICVFSSYLRDFFIPNSWDKSAVTAAVPNFEVFNPVAESWLQLPEPPLKYYPFARRERVSVEAYAVNKSLLIISTNYLGMYFIDLNNQPQQWMWNSIDFSNGIKSFPFAGNSIVIDDYLCVNSKYYYDMNFKSTKSENCISFKLSFPLFPPKGYNILELNKNTIIPIGIGSEDISLINQDSFATVRLGFVGNQFTWEMGYDSQNPHLQVDIFHDLKGRERTASRCEIRNLKTFTYLLGDQDVAMVFVVGCFPHSQ